MGVSLGKKKERIAFRKGGGDIIGGRCSLGPELGEEGLGSQT